MEVNLRISKYVSDKVKSGQFTYADLAMAMGESRQNLSNKIKRGSWILSDLPKLAMFLGCRIHDVFIDIGL